MLVPVSAPLLPNGATPITNNQILRSQAYLFRVNSAADNAKDAVLGACQIPTSLMDTSSVASSSSILAWIQANPGMALAIGVGLLVLMSSGKGRR